ncbi:hypothetical protein SO694_0008615 [Aureococcus anophagefferens]|uniref:Uncharacterized protein n=1 Tax=Aureococcus anophagefferens TaxID=44056 RepID=A0ABR1G3U3_AURAN
MRTLKSDDTAGGRGEIDRRARTSGPNFRYSRARSRFE